MDSGCDSRTKKLWQGAIPIQSDLRRTDFGGTRTIVIAANVTCTRAWSCHGRRGAFPQAALTSIGLGLAFSLFGKCTVSKPFLNSAFTLLASASSGRVNLRVNLP